VLRAAWYWAAAGSREFWNMPGICTITVNLFLLGKVDKVDVDVACCMADRCTRPSPSMHEERQS
jgi:hypothetical protein